MTAVNQFPSLVTSYNQKPKFVAMIKALTDGLYSFQELANIVPSLFNIDTAVGQQLDVLGQWIGFPRTLNISKQWFSFNEPYEGFDMGEWYVFGDVPYTSVTLTDQLYRIILKAKILVNNFDGTRPAFEAILNQLFTLSDVTYKIVQTAPMTLVIHTQGTINQVVFFLLTENIFKIIPMGVSVTWEFNS